MKQILKTVASCVFALVVVSACATREEEVVQQQEATRFGPTTAASDIPTRPTPTPTPSRPSVDDFAVTPVTTPTPAPAARDYPSGVSVADRAGYVRSPYSPEAGLVDVRGIPPGTEVRDPYTGRIFLVP